MMRYTPGEAVHMLERAELLSIIKKDLLNCNRIRNAVPMSKLALARRKATLDSLPRFQGGSLGKIPAITDFRAKALPWARRA